MTTAVTAKINEDDIPVRLDIYVKAGEVLALVDAISVLKASYEDETRLAREAGCTDLEMADYLPGLAPKRAHLERISDKLRGWIRRTYPRDLENQPT